VELTPDEVSERLRAVRERIAGAAARSGREPEAVTLVGVSKRKPASLIVAAVRAGLRDIGESYVQEALSKLPDARRAIEAAGLSPPRCHFVGGLQSNKARDAVQIFDVVESVDRPSLARELSRRAEARGRRMPVLLQVDLAGEASKGGQVDLAGEASKGGVAATDVPALLDLCASLPGLSVDGLMTLPPAASDAEASRPFFARLRELRDSLRGGAAGTGLRELSMGMSADYEVAIEEGATWVRVGTALFGPRED
jgi:pyridoxal phosphate enzyme (YggS family)